MRRKGGGLIGPALICAGLLIVMLGFFGNGMGIPGLLMLGVGQDNPRINIGAFTYIAPGSMQKVTAEFCWVEVLPFDRSVMHVIAGVPLECYFQNQSKGVKYTNEKGMAEWIFVAPSVPGYYEVTVAFNGNAQFPACSDSLGFVVVPAQQQPGTSGSEPQQITNSEAPRTDIVKIVGLSILLLGAIITFAFRRV